MAELVRYEVKDGVAVMTIDNPPVNALAPEVWGQIDEAVKRGVADPAAEALVLIGAGTTFIAGADIKAFELLKTPADSMARSAGTHALLKRMEDATKPLVAAIHGNALGGGLEVAQACHFRVATKDARVGQPEVLLGIIPGAGGTQRLPRLAGAALALTMCTDGKPVAAPKALAAGIIDHIVPDDLLVGAIAFAKAKAKAHEIRKVREIVIGPDGVKAGLDACEAMRASLKKTAKGLRAPYAVVDAIEAGLKLPFDEGSVRERELFADCVASTESKSLRHLFFAEREVAKVPDVPKDTPTREIKRAAVVGAGTMGGGIAMNYANAGIPVLLKEVDQAALDRGLATIRKNYDVTMSKGKMTAEQVEKTMALITPTTSYDGFDQVDIVTEAVFENMELKKATFTDLGKVTRPDCILASNSSTLDI
ncbi:MAG TPA: enoyl-CoA hydratase-related protein, partial [Vicinamibacterales bacterium]|nr:enoyl-CoA hydratase-related protein [Vicinamibacterales bacterium]